MGKTSSENKSKVVSDDLYLRRDKTWWSYMVPGGKKGRVVVERMNFKPEHYSATLKNMDSWEWFVPSKPLDNQNYNRKLVIDCQWPRVSAQWRPAEVPTGGHQNCPDMANRSAHQDSGGIGHEQLDI